MSESELTRLLGLVANRATTPFGLGALAAITGASHAERLRYEVKQHDLKMFEGDS
jgi:hypothetical protein